MTSVIPKARACKIEGCERKHRARGYCSMHYQRWYHHDDPTIVSREQYSDPEESFAARTEWVGDCLIWTGADNGNGYGQIRANGRMQPAHRYAWERVNGPIADGMQIDHREHCDIRCVNVDHLRPATRAENMTNRAGANENNLSTGVRNVYPNKNGFMVRIMKDGKIHNFGTYPTAEEAAEVAAQKRDELFKEFAGRG